MSGKFEVNFESLFERLIGCTAIVDIKAITFYNKHYEICITIFSEG